MSGRMRYTRQAIAANTFYQLPKFLFDAEFEGLSNDARVLYALLRNRHEMSVKNGWFDENDEVYIYFKRGDMGEMLHLSENTVTKAMKDLKGFELVEEVRQGVQKPNRIYLLCADFQRNGVGDAENVGNALNRKTCGSGTSKIAVQDPQNLRVNKNQKEIIYNKINHSQSVSRNPVIVNDYTEQIHKNIDYDGLTRARPHDRELIDEFIAVMVDAMVTHGDTVSIDGEIKPRWLVVNALMKITYDDMNHVVGRFKAFTGRIARKRQYMLTMLYNCKLEIEAHYVNEVMADMAGGMV